MVVDKYDTVLTANSNLQPRVQRSRREATEEGLMPQGEEEIEMEDHTTSPFIHN